MYLLSEVRSAYLVQVIASVKVICISFRRLDTNMYHNTHEQSTIHTEKKPKSPYNILSVLSVSPQCHSSLKDDIGQKWLLI